MKGGAAPFFELKFCIGASIGVESIDRGTDDDRQFF